MESSESDDEKQIHEISKPTGTDTTPPPNESTIKIDTTESAQQRLSTDPAMWPRILGYAERSFLERQVHLNYCIITKI